jgi:hypothetical protein
MGHPSRPEGKIMKTTTRQILIVLTTLVTLTVNGLANALPLNGLNTGEISDGFDIYFVPAGYVFSIWGLIYIGLIAFAIFQALPSQRQNPRLEKIGAWVILANLANAAWIFFWHYQLFPLSLVVMIVLLVSLLFIYQGLGIGRSTVSANERWLARLPFSIYLGWISVATIANVSDVLDYLNWSRFGIAEETWMVLLLAVVGALGWAMSTMRRDIAYLAVLLWALAGIGVKFPQNGIVTTSTWAVFGLVALAFIWAAIPRKLKA